MNSLAARERKFLMVGALFVALCVGYYGYWRPMNNAIAQEQAAAIQARQALQFLQSSEVNSLLSGQQSGAATTRRAPVALLPYMERTLRQLNLSTQGKIAQAGNDAIRIDVDAVAFSRALKLLQQIVTDDAAVISRLQLDALPEVGRVKLQLVLSPTGS